MRKTWSKSIARSASASFWSGHFGMAALFLFSLILLAFSSARPQMVSDVRSRLNDAFVPVVSTFVRPFQEAVLFARSVSGLATMQAENNHLLEENLRLQEWYRKAMSLESENKALRDLLNVKIQGAHQHVTARALTDSGSNFAYTLMIAVGRKDGVEPGQAVLDERGVIGRIVESGDNSARVLLINDMNSRVPVLIEQNKTHAIMAGENAARPYLDHLPDGVALYDGMRVVTSGYGGVFPYGLPVGRLVMDGKSVYVEPYADLSRLLFVRVIKKEDTSALKQIDQ